MKDNVGKRKDWCDLARGFLMFFVFVFHSEVYYGDSHTWSWTFSPFFLTGFIFVSGYLFCSDLSKVSLSNKSLQVVRTIVVPYFFFMALFFLPKALFVLQDARQQAIDIVVFRASWFVVVIGVLQIVYAAILARKPSIKRMVYATGAMFAAGYLLVVMYRVRPDFIYQNVWLESAQLPGKLPFCLNLALVISPFFMLGILYRRYEHRLRIPINGKTLVAVAALYGALWGADHLYVHSYAEFATDAYNNILLMFLYGMVGIVGVVVASKLVQRLPLVNYIGRHSLLFYYFNAVALTVLVRINDKLNILNGGVLGDPIGGGVGMPALLPHCVWNKPLAPASCGQEVGLQQTV